MPSGTGIGPYSATWPTRQCSRISRTSVARPLGVFDRPRVRLAGGPVPAADRRSPAQGAATRGRGPFGSSDVSSRRRRPAVCPSTSSIDVEASDCVGRSCSRTSSAVVATGRSSMAAASPSRATEQIIGRREFADLHVCLARRHEQPWRCRVRRSSSSACGTVEQIRRGREVAAGQRASSRRRESGRGPNAERHGLVVERPELAAVAIRLLEVVPEDLLELGLAAAPPVHLVGPLDEPLVQRHTFALRAGSRTPCRGSADDRTDMRPRRPGDPAGRTACGRASRGGSAPSAVAIRRRGAGRHPRRRRARRPMPARRHHARLSRGRRGGPRAGRGSPGGTTRSALGSASTHDLTVTLKRPVVDQHRHHLLDEQRVALRRPRRCGRRSPGRVPMRPSSSPIIRPVSPADSGCEHDQAVAVPFGPLRMAIEQLVPSRAEDEDRHGTRPSRRGGRAGRAASSPPRGCRRRSSRAAVRGRAPRAACATPQNSSATGNCPRARPIAAATRSTTAARSFSSTPSSSTRRPILAMAASTVSSDGDLGHATHDLGDRPERDAVAVRQTSSADDVRPA